MRRDLAGAVRALAVPTIALAAVAAFVPGRLELATRAYALVLCAVALALALLALRRAFPVEHPLQPQVRVARTRRRAPPTLARIEHEAALGVAGSFDLHFRLAPRVRAIAAGLLTARRQISLDGDPAAARELVGDATCELVRAHRPPPENRLERGIAVQELGLVVDSLERI